MKKIDDTDELFGTCGLQTEMKGRFNIDHLSDTLNLIRARREEKLQNEILWEYFSPRFSRWSNGEKPGNTGIPLADAI